MEVELHLKEKIKITMGTHVTLFSIVTQECVSNVKNMVYA